MPTTAQWLLALLVILSSLGMILVRKPVHASLCFLMTLISLAAIYLQLSAHFIGVMQILIYAGAILVLFMFVMILFQDAHFRISAFKMQSFAPLLYIAGGGFLLTILSYATMIYSQQPLGVPSADFGTVQSIGQILYINFFFPFEAIILLFLVAMVGALYIAKKES